MAFNISILNFYLHLVFNAFPTRQIVTMNDYYDLSDYEIITTI